ncbi:hypothetical protein CTI14_01090 [Methylobacterium radiotolerans]|nr:hypothetical protein CTI14_01090 [Methylobacterium radiotolerans]
MPEGTKRQAMETSTCLLTRIADDLGVPLTEFFEPHLLCGTADKRSEDVFTIYALVRAYLAIGDVKARDQVVALARSFASTDPGVEHGLNLRFGSSGSHE